MSTFERDARLILSDVRGIYIPRDFCEGITEDECASLNIDWMDVQCCQRGPDEEWYWEAWSAIEQNLLYTDDNGRQWRIIQNGDLWEVPADCEIPEEFFC